MTKTSTRVKIASIILTLLLPTVALANDDKSSPPANLISIHDLLADKIKQTQKEKSSALVKNNLRLEMLREVALAVGASAGLAYEYEKIYGETLKNRANDLDREFNFEKLKLSAGIMPPVITQSHAPYQMEDDDTILIGQAAFKIEKKARMVSAYPTWRDYLKYTPQDFDLPPSPMLPKNAEESELWNMAVKEGWLAGQKQANDTWKHSLGELQRDYNGMLLYQTLLNQGQISPTVVANSKLGRVVSQDGTEMSLDVNQIQIADHSRFIPFEDSRKNTPSVYKDLNGNNY